MKSEESKTGIFFTFPKACKMLSFAGINGSGGQVMWFHLTSSILHHTSLGCFLAKRGFSSVQTESLRD